MRMGETGFSDQLRDELSGKTAKAFRMWPWTAAELKKNRTARLIAALPFIAGCEHPERTALAHLATFVLASSESCKRVFDHDESDNASPTARLAPIADFQGGDKAVIEEGMARLAMIMANGYQKDLEKDKKSGEYNPILAGAWKHETMASGLKSAITTEAVKTIDSVMTKDEALRSYWAQ